MAKENGRGDRMERDRSRGGIRPVPVKGDGVGGNILAVFDLLDGLMEFFRTRIETGGRYSEFSGFADLCARFSEIFAWIKKVDPDGAQIALQTFWGEVTQLLRQRDEQAEQITTLDASLQAMSEERIRVDSRSRAQSSAEQFMVALTKQLSDYHQRLEKMIGDYKRWCTDLETGRDKVRVAADQLAIEVANALAEINVGTWQAARHYTTSRCLAVEQLVAGELTAHSRNDLETKRTEIEKDLRWWSNLKGKLEQLDIRIKKLQETITTYQDLEAITAKKSIQNIKLGIRNLLTTFEAVGQGHIFWGCVYGLQEVFDYNPPDLIIYRFDWPNELVPINEVEKCCEQCQWARELIIDRLSRLAGVTIAETVPVVVQPDDTAEEIDDVTPDDDEESSSAAQSDVVLPLPEVTLTTRQEELARMVLCTLWAFIERNVQQAQNANKKLIREGDYGRTARVVGKLLLGTGYIQRNEQTFVESVIMITLVNRGLARSVTKLVKGRIYPIGEKKERQETYYFLTRSGRLEVVRICDTYRALMVAVLKEQEEREQKYWLRHPKK